MKHQHPRRRPLRSLAPLSGLAALLIAGATVSTSLGQTARPAATQPATAPASADPDADAELYRGTDRFLGAVVTEAGFVDYAEARRHRKQLDQLVASLAKDRGKRTREQTLALLINAYNLLVIQQVLDEYINPAVAGHGGEIERQAQAPGERHLRRGHQQAAFRAVVRRAHVPRGDQLGQLCAAPGDIVRRCGPESVVGWFCCGSCRAGWVSWEMIRPGRVPMPYASYRACPCVANNRKHGCVDGSGREHRAAFWSRRG